MEFLVKTTGRDVSKIQIRKYENAIAQKIDAGL